ncbi:tetratricopeptide repeat protein [Robiginitalea sp. IMCC43444]|uniref:tetratricopeptide repeat protein n=1 Tax=Robiginitalea sp. IMCC43444 TaxID=3459121 RepID=UPI004042C43D
MDAKNFYKELIRRNVIRALIAYLAVSWVLIQIASTLFPVFNAPTYLLQGLIYLLAIGFVFWMGFSWVYDLTPKGIQKTPEFSVTSVNRELNSRRLNTVILGAGLSAFLILLAGSFWAGSNWNKNEETLYHKNYRIAVLPFEDRSDNAEFGYLREGLAEDVISELCQFSSVSVISSRSTFKFNTADNPISQISRELKADILLMGSYSIYSKSLDVKIEVIDGTDNEVLSYATFTGDLSRVKDLLTDIGENIYKGLKITEKKLKKVKRSEAADLNVEAYKYNAMGKSAMHDHTGQKLEDITRYFKTAIKLDSNYVEPYIGMAEAYIFDVSRGYLSSAEGAWKAKQYALEAEKLDPGSGKVSGILGIVHCLNFEFRKAIPYFEKSLEESPNFDLTYHWYAFALQILGDFEKAIELRRKAKILDPLNAFNDIYLTLSYIFQGDLNSAEEVIKTKLELIPDHKQMLWLQAVVLSEKGLYEEAYQTLLKRNFGLETNFIAGYVYAKTGREDKALVVLNNMLEASKTGYVSPSQLAVVLCSLNKYEQALEQVEEAYLKHDQWINWIKNTSLVDPIKKTPRYLNIMDRLVQ